MEYEKKIVEIIALRDTKDPDKICQALEDAIALLETINDERESVWSMLEEMRASDLKNHADVQKRTIDNAINRAKLLMTTKVGKA